MNTLLVLARKCGTLTFVLALAHASHALATPCGTGNYPFPFADVAGVADPFCPGIMEAYVTGVSKGTSPTTFSPSQTVDRTQMTTFLQRSLDQGLHRGSRRAALGQWWTSSSVVAMQSVATGAGPGYCAADGKHVWVANWFGGSVTQLEARTGKIVGTWTGAPSGLGILAAAGRVFVVANTNPGQLYVLDPTLPAGPMTAATSGFGNSPVLLAWDGARLWAVNSGASGGVTIITVQPTLPYPTTTVTAGLGALAGIAYDGKNIWVADASANAIHKLDAAGSILQTVALGIPPTHLTYDGANLWVTSFSPNPNGSLVVVQASSGSIVATIAGDASNGIKGPQKPAFDGERIVVPNYYANAATVFKAADLSVMAQTSLGAGAGPSGACSDGIDLWIPLTATNRIVRF